MILGEKIGDYLLDKYTERIALQRNKAIESLVIAEVKTIAFENGLETLIDLNEHAVIEMLKKQTPTKVLRNGFGEHCPRCSTNCGILRNASYCPVCGQALIWSTDEKGGAE